MKCKIKVFKFDEEKKLNLVKKNYNRFSLG